jgi:hypothetical protein
MIFLKSPKRLKKKPELYYKNKVRSTKHQVRSKNIGELTVSKLSTYFYICRLHIDNNKSLNYVKIAIASQRYFQNLTHFCL